jgi:hypothetical protein
MLSTKLDHLHRTCSLLNPMKRFTQHQPFNIALPHNLKSLTIRAQKNKKRTSRNYINHISSVNLHRRTPKEPSRCGYKSSIRDGPPISQSFHDSQLIARLNLSSEEAAEIPTPQLNIYFTLSPSVEDAKLSFFQHLTPSIVVWQLYHYRVRFTGLEPRNIKQCQPFRPSERTSAWITLSKTLLSDLSSGYWCISSDRSVHGSLITVMGSVCRYISRPAPFTSSALIVLTEEYMHWS